MAKADPTIRERRTEDLTGKGFGRLTVIRFGWYSNRKAVWWCYCDPSRGGCGIGTTVKASQLKRGKTRSCGCLHIDTAKTHGQSHNASYHSWRAMKCRCLNEKATGYEGYGGRGITICDRWISSFENFINDMGPRPSLEYSIERIDTNGNYEPGNCRWATIVEQTNNTRRTRYVTFNGETIPLAVAARKYGVAPERVRQRLSRGWPLQRALGQ